jgi:hypothetical protein
MNDREVYRIVLGAGAVVCQAFLMLSGFLALSCCQSTDDFQFAETALFFLSIHTPPNNHE